MLSNLKRIFDRFFGFSSNSVHRLSTLSLDSRHRMLRLLGRLKPQIFDLHLLLKPTYHVRHQDPPSIPLNAMHRMGNVAEIHRRNSVMARWGIPGISFSLKRALGLTALRQKVAKAIKVPTTRSGMERKIGRAILDTLFKKR